MDFETVYQLYFRDVYAFIRSLSAREDVAEEITQETFFKALKNIDRFDGTKDIRAWLFTIARNTFYSWHRRLKFHADGGMDENQAAKEQGLAQRMADRESAMRIHHFLHKMKEPYKEVFSLRVFGELSFEQIGQIFGKSAGWARVVYYRAKEQIIDYMEVNKNE